VIFSEAFKPAISPGMAGFLFAHPQVVHIEQQKTARPPFVSPLFLAFRDSHAKLR
jgi:hypothetical protein